MKQYKERLYFVHEKIDHLFLVKQGNVIFWNNVSGIATTLFADIRNLPTKINGLSWNSMRYDNIFRKVMK
jgi:hypothetical protein